MLLGDMVRSGVGPYVIGGLVLAAATVVMRAKDVPLFVEQLAVPALLVGGGTLAIPSPHTLGWRSEFGDERRDAGQFEIPHRQRNRHREIPTIGRRDAIGPAIVPRLRAGGDEQIDPEAVGLAARQIERHCLDAGSLQFVSRHGMLEGNQRIRIPIGLEGLVAKSPLIQTQLVLPEQACVTTG